MELDEAIDVAPMTTSGAHCWVAVAVAAGLLHGAAEAQDAGKVAAIDTLIAGATPGRSTLRALCGARADLGAGIVFGVVRAVATRIPLAGAGVSISWYEPKLVRGTLRADVRHVDGTTTTSGTYALCGVPRYVRANIAAQVGRHFVGPVGMESDSGGRHRIDLMAPLHDSMFGTVTGIVRGPDGRAASRAEVRIAGTDGTVQADSSGRFRVESVPAGTRELQVRMIGAAPARLRADVPSDSETFVDVALGALGQALPTVNVFGTRSAYARSGFDERRAAGRGFFRTAREIASINAWDLADIVARAPGVDSKLEKGRRMLTFPGTSLQASGRVDEDTSTRAMGCPPRVFLNGVLIIGSPYVTAFEMAMTMARPEDVYGIEMYRYEGYMPRQFRGSDACSSVVIWTK